MEDDAQGALNEKTRAAEEQTPRAAGADREPTPQEEELADEVAEDLTESGELERAAEHEQEMNRLGAEVKGEGQIP